MNEQVDGMGHCDKHGSFNTIDGCLLCASKSKVESSKEMSSNRVRAAVVKLNELELLNNGRTYRKDGEIVDNLILVKKVLSEFIPELSGNIQGIAAADCMKDLLLWMSNNKNCEAIVAQGEIFDIVCKHFMAIESLQVEVAEYKERLDKSYRLTLLNTLANNQKVKDGPFDRLIKIRKLCNLGILTEVDTKEDSGG